MILLGHEYLLFELSSGERVPCSAESIVGELLGEEVDPWEAELLEQTVRAVFHYFRHELARDSVTFDEFGRVLERALRALTEGAGPVRPAVGPGSTDLLTLARSTSGVELLFFAQLRHAVQRQLEQTPERIRFRGLRDSVKHLAGVRRWCPRCRDLQERILDYLRACVRAHAPGDCLLVVD